jgi:hypothetical protein
MFMPSAVTTITHNLANLDARRLMRLLCVPLVAIVIVVSGCKSSSSAAQGAAEKAVSAPPEPFNLPSVDAQAGVGHPTFKIAAPPQYSEGGIESVVVPPNTKDADIVRLLWYFRSLAAERRWRDLGISTPILRPSSGEPYGMVAVYKGPKCATELDPEPTNLGPCGSGSHSSGFYQWGIVGFSHGDEGVLVDWDGSDPLTRTEKTVFASAKDHWEMTDEVRSRLKQR